MFKLVNTHYYLMNLMAQLQTFTANDYLLKNNCFDNNELRNRRKNWEKNTAFSGYLLIGQNDSLDVLLLVEILVQFK